MFNKFKYTADHEKQWDELDRKYGPLKGFEDARQDQSSGERKTLSKKDHPDHMPINPVDRFPVLKRLQKELGSGKLLNTRVLVYVQGNGVVLSEKQNMKVDIFSSFHRVGHSISR